MQLLDCVARLEQVEKLLSCFVSHFEILQSISGHDGVIVDIVQYDNHWVGREVGIFDQ